MKTNKQKSLLSAFLFLSLSLMPAFAPFADLYGAEPASLMIHKPDKAADVTPPVALCKDLMLTLDIYGVVEITSYDVDNGSYDESGTVEFSLSKAVFTCEDIGENEVVLTVTDFEGNASSCVAIVTVIDNTPPVALCKDHTLFLVNGMATLEAADVDDGSYDNCDITMSVTPSSFTCENAGPNAVTLTVTDASGNTATCTSTVNVQYMPECQITAIASEGSTTGAAPTTIYLGYGPQDVTLEGSASGGIGFTYAWSPAEGLSCSNCQAPVFTPTEEGLYTFTLTVTNSNGCSASSSITLCVLDIRVPGSNGKRVYLCHALPNGGAVTMGLPIAVVPQHIPGHEGDHLGACGQSCDSLKIGGSTNRDAEIIHEEGSDFETILYPNPFEGEMTLIVHGHSGENASIFIYDLAGRQVQLISQAPVDAEIFIGRSLEKGIYFLKVFYNGQTQTMKIIKAH